MKFALVLAVLATIVTTPAAAVPTFAVGSVYCGTPPIPPAGCKGAPRCVCDGSGNCQWVFNC